MTPLRLIKGDAPTEQPRPFTRPPLRVVKQGPCPCRDPSCRAQTLWAQRDPDYVQMAKRCFDRVRAKPGDLHPHEDGTWQEMTSTRGWLPVRVVTVSGVDLDSGKIGDVRYTARMVAGALEVKPLPEQPGVSAEDADHYWLAAVHQARLEMGLGELDLTPSAEG